MSKCISELTCTNNIEDFAQVTDSWGCGPVLVHLALLQQASMSAVAKGHDMTDTNTAASSRTPLYCLAEVHIPWQSHIRIIQDLPILQRIFAGHKRDLLGLKVRRGTTAEMLDRLNCCKHVHEGSESNRSSNRLALCTPCKHACDNSMTTGSVPVSHTCQTHLTMTTP